MKPLHEDTLRTVQTHGDGRHAIIASDGRMVAETRAQDGQSIARGLAAMPRLVKSLVAVAEESSMSSVDGVPCWCLKGTRDRMRTGLQSHHDSFCQEARAALREVGAL